MSTAPADTLAPLHRLVLVQIEIAAARERATCDEVAEALGDEARECLRVARQGHPVPTPARLAERLRESGDAHGTLADGIRRQLAREAAAWRALVERFGDEAEVRLRMAAEDHGRACGARAAEEHGHGTGGPAAAFDLLGGALLEGLPCAVVARVERDTDASVSWSHARCPYEAPWSDAGVDRLVACNVVSAWRRGFTSGFDAGVEYRRPASIAAGDGRCEHAIAIRHD